MHAAAATGSGADGGGISRTRRELVPAGPACSAVLSAWLSTIGRVPGRATRRSRVPNCVNVVRRNYFLSERGERLIAAASVSSGPPTDFGLLGWSGSQHLLRGVGGFLAGDDRCRPCRSTEHA